MRTPRVHSGPKAEPVRKSRGLILILALLLLGAGLVVVMALTMARNPDRGGGVLPTELGELPVSTIAIPVVYSPEDLIERLERAAPMRLGGLEERWSSPTDPRLHYAFDAEREPFDVEVRGNTVHLSTIVRYSGQVWYETPLGLELTAACGVADGETASDAPRALVAFSTPIEVDEGWNLRSRVTVERVEPLTPDDRCRMSVLQFQLDATEPIMAEVRRWLDEEAGRFDSALAALPLRPFVEGAWATIQQPVSLASNTWLSLSPIGLAYCIDSRLASPLDPIQGQLQITAQPRIIVGRSPDISPRPLPPLGSELKGVDPWVVVEGRVEYEALSAFVSGTVRGRRFQFADETIEILSLELSGSDDGWVAAELEVSGGREGRVRLVGTPAFDASAGQIRFPDLEVSVETDDLLARATAWLMSLGRPIYADLGVTVPMSEMLAAVWNLPNGLSYQISDEVNLEGELGSPEITGVAATGAGIIVRSRVRPGALLRIGRVESALSPQLGAR